LLAAFTPSAIRLYVIGSQTFGQAVSNEVAMTAVGFATVLSAEIGQIVFSLALATLGTSQSARRLLITSGSLGVNVAIGQGVQWGAMWQHPSHPHGEGVWRAHVGVVAVVCHSTQRG
jgi:hypothetical protein